MHIVHPIAMRKGMRLFDDAKSPIPLRLVSSQPFTTGVIYLVYTPAEAPAGATYDDTKAHLPNADH